jgi:hypothetical protein
MKFKKPTEIVFVQLGSSNASHLISNIQLISNLMPHIQINCVISENSKIVKNLPNNVNIFLYKPTQEINTLFESKIADISFRNGFWRYSLERLLTISMVHSLRPKTGLLHVESDILLLPGFPISKFEELDKISWLESSINSDIASLIYFPNQSLTRDFTEDILNYIKFSSSPTDMSALNQLRSEQPNKYSLLQSTNANFPKLQNFEPVVNQKEINFNGIFDAACIGMWLTGIDPRIGYGLKRYFATEKLNKSNFRINPASYPLRYVQGEGLYFINGANKLQIYSLHIHSKSKKIFSQKYEQELLRLVNLSLKNKTYTVFSLKVFVGLLVSNYSNKTLLRYIYNSPIFWFLRKINAILNKQIAR